MSEPPLAAGAFDRLASGYDERGADEPVNAHHELNPECYAYESANPSFLCLRFER
jgi:hypothetical protein